MIIFNIVYSVSIENLAATVRHVVMKPYYLISWSYQSISRSTGFQRIFKHYNLSDIPLGSHDRNGMAKQEHNKYCSISSIIYERFILTVADGKMKKLSSV